MKPCTLCGGDVKPAKYGERIDYECINCDHDLHCKGCGTDSVPVNFGRYISESTCNKCGKEWDIDWDEFGGDTLNPYIEASK